MKYIYFGTPRFAKIVLNGLLVHGLVPVALVANPDRPVGRKKVMTAPATKQLLAELAPHVPAMQPETLDTDFIKKLSALAPDVFVVAAYAKIIPKAVLDVARLGTIGTHPSLLPEYRGASPIQSVILDGKTETGVSLYLMDAKMDRGPILAQESLNFDPEVTNYLTLEEKLGELSAKLLLNTLPGFENGIPATKEQDHAAASFTKKFTTQDAFVDPKELARAFTGDTQLARKILYKINALNPEPGVWTLDADGKRLKLLKGAIKNDTLVLTLVQKEGGRPETFTSH